MQTVFRVPNSFFLSLRNFEHVQIFFAIFFSYNCKRLKKKKKSQVGVLVAKGQPPNQHMKQIRLHSRVLGAPDIPIMKLLQKLLLLTNDCPQQQPLLTETAFLFLFLRLSQYSAAGYLYQQPDKTILPQELQHVGLLPDKFISIFWKSIFDIIYKGSLLSSVFHRVRRKPSAEKALHFKNPVRGGTGLCH